MNHNVEISYASVKLLLVTNLECNVNISIYNIIHHD
jgi:hypothetical protein